MPNSDTKTNVLPQNHLAVAIYNNFAEVEVAIQELLYSGFKRPKLTCINRWGGGICDRWGHQCFGLDNLKIPKDSVQRYETALQKEKSILIAQWTMEEVPGGCEEINRTHPESVDEHPFSATIAEPDLQV